MYSALQGRHTSMVARMYGAGTPTCSYHPQVCLSPTWRLKLGSVPSPLNSHTKPDEAKSAAPSCTAASKVAVYCWMALGQKTSVMCRYSCGGSTMLLGCTSMGKLTPAWSGNKIALLPTGAWYQNWCSWWHDEPLREIMTLREKCSCSCPSSCKHTCQAKSRNITDVDVPLPATFMIQLGHATGQKKQPGNLPG